MSNTWCHEGKANIKCLSEVLGHTAVSLSLWKCTGGICSLNWLCWLRPVLNKLVQKKVQNSPGLKAMFYFVLFLLSTHTAIIMMKMMRIINRKLLEKNLIKPDVFIVFNANCENTNKINIGNYFSL